MRWRLLTLTTSTFILALIGMPLNAEQGSGVQEGQQTQQQTERALPVHYRDDDWDRYGPRIMRDRDDDWDRHGPRMMRDRDDDDCYGPGMMRGGRGDWHGPGMMRGWRDRMQQRGWGPGAMGMMGPGELPMMMRMMTILADIDNDGSVSLQEFQAAHERMFKAMDANKDGRLTAKELQSFMQGSRSPAQQQQ
jgi:hypothetical protein